MRLQDLLERDYAEWLPKLTFIKVDAEGHDAVILESITDLIEAYRPTIVAEVFGKDAREGKERLYRGLDRPGYELRLLHHDFDSRTPLEPIRSPDDVIGLEETMNVIAVPSARSSPSPSGPSEPPVR